MLGVASRTVILLDECFVFDFKIFNFVVSLGELHGNFVSLFLGCLLLSHQDILMDLDLFLSLLHGHFELVFLIF